MSRRVGLRCMQVGGKAIPPPGTDYLASTLAYLEGYAFQRKCFFHNGFYYVFLEYASAIRLFSSPNRETWTDKGVVVPSCEGIYFSIFYDGTYVHAVYRYGGDLKYRKGTPSAGDVSWNTEKTIYDPVSPYSIQEGCTICKTTNGDLWAGWLSFNSTDSHYYVHVSHSTDGGDTWTSPTTVTHNPNDHGVSVLPLTSSSIIIIFYRWSNARTSARTWDGTTLGVFETIGGHAQETWGWKTTLNVGNKIHVVYLATDGVLYHNVRDGSWGTEVAVVTNLYRTGVPYSPFTIAYNETKVILYWFRTPDGDIYYKEYSDATWSDETFLRSMEGYSPKCITTNRIDSTQVFYRKDTNTYFLIGV